MPQRVREKWKMLLMGQSWFRQGEIAEIDSTIGDCRKQSKIVTANDDVFAEDLRLAA
jgi:hypothetical protein